MIECKYKELKGTDVSPGSILIITDFKCLNENSGYTDSSEVYNVNLGLTISPCDSCMYKEE